MWWHNKRCIWDDRTKGTYGMTENRCIWDDRTKGTYGMTEQKVYMRWQNKRCIWDDRTKGAHGRTEQRWIWDDRIKVHTRWQTQMSLWDEKHICAYEMVKPMCLTPAHCTSITTLDVLEAYEIFNKKLWILIFCSWLQTVFDCKSLI